MARTTSAQRARRLLALLHLLEPGERVELSAIADTLGTSVSQVTADLESLACCGLAPYTPERLIPLLIEDGYVEVFGELPALDRPVRLSRAELLALVTALESAGVAEGDPLLARLQAASSPTVSREEIERTVLNRGSASPDVLKTLAVGLQESRRVRISYRAQGRDSDTDRVIEPLGMLNERGAWYVEALCLSAGALRTFRADRIRTAELTGERFEPASLSPLSGAFDPKDLPVATIRFASADLFDEREWPASSLVGRRSDGALDVAVPYGGLQWISRQVVARLGDVVVLEPGEVRAAVRELASDLLG